MSKSKSNESQLCQGLQSENKMKRKEKEIKRTDNNNKEIVHGRLHPDAQILY